MTLRKITFASGHTRYDRATPRIPDIKPIITVSALNMPETLDLDAPIARKIPISFVLSWTEIKVITAIIIDETTKEIAANATKTLVIMVKILPTEDKMNPT